MKGAHRRGGARKRQWVLKLLLVGLEKKQWMWIFLEVQLRPLNKHTLGRKVKDQSEDFSVSCRALSILAFPLHRRRG